jgi:isopenicillin N synthase-like dioxygenase
MALDGFDDIPIVDFTGVADGGPRFDEVALELRGVCHEVGFFIVENHGVQAVLVDAVFDMMRDFFALPEEKKLLIDKRRSPQFRGWESVGTERTNNRPDYREQIDLWSEWPACSYDVEPEFLRLLGPNQWMPDDVVPGQRALMGEWFDSLGHLAGQILRLLSVGLCLDEQHLTSYFGQQPMSLTKLISYPPTPVGGAGVNAHHDTGFLTVLAAGSTPGLQVQNPAGDWIPVPCIDGSFVVNLGEMLQAVTGNYFVATPHRVITSAPRLSAGYFHGPSLLTELDPLPLDRSFTAAVAGSPRHLGAGFMAQADETKGGVGDMASAHRPDTYGQQLWNYFKRSYPDMMRDHH